MWRKQALVAVGMIAAILVLVTYWIQLGILPLPTPIDDDRAARLAFAVQWLLLPALTLFFGIAVIANQRFFVVDAIDGATVSENRVISVTLRYNQNTLEQTVLAAAAWTGLALALPHGMLKLIPAMAIGFVAGRVLFWVGYLVFPAGRALGFGLTAYPTFAALIWLALRALR